MLLNLNSCSNTNRPFLLLSCRFRSTQPQTFIISDHTNIIRSRHNTLRNVKKISNTFTQVSPHNTSVPEKITKLLTPQPVLGSRSRAQADSEFFQEVGEGVTKNIYYSSTALLGCHTVWNF